MKTLKCELRTAIAIAAEMRAAGRNWSDVAKTVKRSASRLMHWPRVYRRHWMACYRAAETHLHAEAGAEAVLFLRNFMRGDNAKLALRAAELLLKSRQTDRLTELQSAADDDFEAQAADLVDHLEQLDESQLPATPPQNPAAIIPTTACTDPTPAAPEPENANKGDIHDFQKHP